MEESKLARATKAELLQVALDHGVETSDVDTNATLRTKIRAALGLVAPQKPTGKVPTLEGEGREGDLRPVRIRIPAQDGDKQPVYVAVNGRSFVIQRDLEAEVPLYIYRALMNAIKTVIDPETRQAHEMPQYPVQVLDRV